MGGQIQNNYSETYTYLDFGIGAKYHILMPDNKISWTIGGGLKYIASSIHDNADGNPDDFMFNSNTNFQEGTFSKTASGFGPYIDFGMTYNLSKKWSISGLVHLNFINLDFEEFSANALGPGFGLRFTYYQDTPKKNSSFRRAI